METLLSKIILKSLNKGAPGKKQFPPWRSIKYFDSDSNKNVTMIKVTLEINSKVTFSAKPL